MKMKKWSSQWTQFMQLRKEAWKKFRTSTGFEPVTSRYRCHAPPTELWSHWRSFTGTYEPTIDLLPRSRVQTSLKSFFSGFFTQLHKFRSLRRSFLHLNFISAVHIWFISYIINTHFFHGNIWTHNWPAPKVSGFIAQLVEHRTGNREVTGSNLVEVLNFFLFFRFLYAIA